MKALIACVAALLCIGCSPQSERLHYAKWSPAAVPKIFISEATVAPLKSATSHRVRVTTLPPSPSSRLWRPLWSAKLPVANIADYSNDFQPVAAIATGNFFVVSAGNTISAFNAATGRLAWRKGNVYRYPIAGSDGVLYTAQASSVDAVHAASGKIVWKSAVCKPGRPILIEVASAGVFVECSDGPQSTTRQSLALLSAATGAVTYRKSVKPGCNGYPARTTLISNSVIAVGEDCEGAIGYRRLGLVNMATGKEVYETAGRSISGVRGTHVILNDDGDISKLDKYDPADLTDVDITNGDIRGPWQLAPDASILKDAVTANYKGAGSVHVVGAYVYLALGDRLYRFRYSAGGVPDIDHPELLLTGLATFPIFYGTRAIVARERDGPAALAVLNLEDPQRSTLREFGAAPNANAGGMREYVKGLATVDGGNSATSFATTAGTVLRAPPGCTGTQELPVAADIVAMLCYDELSSAQGPDHLYALSLPPR